MGRLVAKCSERTGPQFCPRQVEHLGESDEQKTYLQINARIPICMRDHERDRIRFSAPLPRWEAFRFKGRRLASAPESGLSPNRTPAELAAEEGSEPFRHQNLLIFDIHLQLFSILKKDRQFVFASGYTISFFKRIPNRNCSDIPSTPPVKASLPAPIALIERYQRRHTSTRH